MIINQLGHLRPRPKQSHGSTTTNSILEERRQDGVLDSQVGRTEMHGIGAKAACLNHARATAGVVARCTEQECTIRPDIVAALRAFEIDLAVESVGHGMSLSAQLRRMAGSARKAIELAGEDKGTRAACRNSRPDGARQRR